MYFGQKIRQFFKIWGNFGLRNNVKKWTKNRAENKVSTSIKSSENSSRKSVFFFDNFHTLKWPKSILIFPPVLAPLK